MSGADRHGVCPYMRANARIGIRCLLSIDPSRRLKQILKPNSRNNPSPLDNTHAEHTETSAKPTILSTLTHTLLEE